MKILRVCGTAGLSLPLMDRRTTMSPLAVIEKLKGDVLLLDWDFVREGILLARIDVEFTNSHTRQERIDKFEEILDYVLDDKKPVPELAILRSRLPSEQCMVKSLNLRTGYAKAIPNSVSLFVMGEVVNRS